MVVFNHFLFKSKVFNAFNARQWRARKIAQMIELERIGYSKERLKEMGYGDCMGEVESYSEDQSSWISKGARGINEPSYYYIHGMKDRDTEKNNE